MGTNSHISVGMISGFQVVVGLWGWELTVMLHAVWRSLLRVTAQDPIRESGPTQ